MSADGTRIGFLTAGSGPPLLLVHGGMCSSRRWGPLWPLLTGHFQVTAMDRRGRGSSGDAARHSLRAEAADVAAVVRHLADRDGGPIDVFGHSFGAVSALAAAARGAPVRRLALYDPPGPQAVPVEWLARTRSMIAEGQLGHAMLGFLLTVVGLTRAQVEELRDTRQGEDPMPILERTLVREAEALRAADLPALARSVDQPVLLLLGATSPPWAEAVSHDVAAALPTSELVVLPGQGHEAVDTAPDLVASLLRAFLQGRWELEPPSPPWSG